MQQHLVEAVELHHRAVVILHELFDRQVFVLVREAELLGQGALIVEQQSVLAPSGEAMEREADTPQQALAHHQGLVLVLGEEAVGNQVVQVLGVEVAFGDPADHLDVAQSPGIFLDVGLQVVGGAAELAPTRLLLFDLGGKEGLARPDAVAGRGGPHALEQVRRAGEPARLDEVGHDGRIGAGYLHAVRDGPDAVPRLQPDIEEEGDEPAQGLFLCVFQEDHDVHVRTRMELPASVASDRHQRRSRPRRYVALPDLLQQYVHQVAAGKNQIADRCALVIALEQVFRGLAQGLAKGGDGVVPGIQAVLQLGPRLGPAAGLLLIGIHDSGCFSRSSPRRVKTSWPSSVTKIVCSHWADRLRSLVTTVQPSGSCLMSRLPALTMGSTVKHIPGARIIPSPGLP